MTTLVIIDAGNWFKEKEHLHQKYYNECYYEWKARAVDYGPTARRHEKNQKGLENPVLSGPGGKPFIVILWKGSFKTVIGGFGQGDPLFIPIQLDPSFPLER